MQQMKDIKYTAYWNCRLYQYINGTAGLHTRKRQLKPLQAKFLSDLSLEGGAAALRVLELLPGFWSCSQGFGVICENLSDLLDRVL